MHFIQINIFFNLKPIHIGVFKCPQKKKKQ